jgi:hypothetical protein
MVWIPIEDGGSMQVPITDPRARPFLRDTGPKPPPRQPTDYPGFSRDQLNKTIARRIRADFERRAAEEAIVQNLVYGEPLPTAAWVNREDAAHDRAVIDVINYCMGWAADAGPMEIEDQLVVAREHVTALRERSNANAKSLILRDAERYLWGRAGVTVYRRDDDLLGSDPVTWAPANGIYNAIKAFFMAGNAAFGTNWGKSNPNRPFSPLGGEFWFQFGLADYLSWDRPDPHARRPAQRPSVAQVAARRNLNVARGQSVDY